LVVGKNGLKLRETSADAETVVPASPSDKTLYSGQGDARMLENGSLVVTGGPLGPIRGGRGAGGMRFEFAKLTMAGLGDLLAPHKDLRIVDMTGLKGA